MVVWISLLVRKALLLIAIAFAPIALAGSSWDHTRSWVSRWATFVIAMILSGTVALSHRVRPAQQIFLSAPRDSSQPAPSAPPKSS